MKVAEWVDPKTVSTLEHRTTSPVTRHHSTCDGEQMTTASNVAHLDDGR